MTNSRKKDEQRYQKYYKRVSSLDMRKCAYCNDPFQCYDHAPPISKIKNYNPIEFLKDGGKFLLYPACLNCNATLGTFESFRYEDRLSFISSRLAKKTESVDLWTQKELNELGKTLRSLIEKANNEKKDMINRMLRCDEMIDKVFLGEINPMMIYGSISEEDYDNVDNPDDFPVLAEENKKPSKKNKTKQ